jgi:hypothetical protein
LVNFDILCPTFSSFGSLSDIFSGIGNFSQLLAHFLILSQLFANFLMFWHTFSRPDIGGMLLLLNWSKTRLVLKMGLVVGI